MSRKTSIVVLTYNELSFTEQCLESIRAHTDPDHYELIVVDNASTDGTREWLTAQSGIKLLLNDDNKGFPAGCNQGVALAEPGNDILLLNNDTIVTENWLLGLQAALHSSDTVGAVGPITNYAMYNQSIPVSYSSLQEMHAFARTVSETALDQPYERRLKLIGFCYLIKREALNQVGLLDERFTPEITKMTTTPSAFWKTGMNCFSATTYSSIITAARASASSRSSSATILRATTSFLRRSGASTPSIPPI